MAHDRVPAGASALVLTASDRSAAGEREDASGALVAERLAGIGLAEAMRAAGRAKTPLADLSRSLAGVAGRTLILNLPGSPKAAAESLDAILAAIPHALETLAGPFDHETRR